MLDGILHTTEPVNTEIFEIPTQFQGANFCTASSKALGDERVYSRDLKGDRFLPHLSQEDEVNFAKYFDYQYDTNSSMLGMLKFGIYAKIEFMSITTNGVVSIAVDMKLALYYFLVCFCLSFTHLLSACRHC